MPKKGTPEYEVWIGKYRIKRASRGNDNKLVGVAKEEWFKKFKESKARRKQVIKDARNLEIDLSPPQFSTSISKFNDLSEQAMFFATAFRSGLNWEYMKRRYDPKKLATEEFPIQMTRQIWRDLRDAYAFCLKNKLIPKPY